MVHGPVLLRNLDALEPLGKSFRHVLLNEPLAPDAGRVTLHRDRAASNVGKHDRSDRLVVRRERPLRDSIVGEEHLVGMPDHARSLTTSRAVLSVRTPSSRGCRSLLWTVHS